jgi:peptidoglycan hydrolase-like protein with peptidoglycan-binding domain
MRTIRMDSKRTTNALAAALAVLALTVAAPAARADDTTGTPTPTGTSGTAATTSSSPAGASTGTSAEQPAGTATATATSTPAMTTPTTTTPAKAPARSSSTAAAAAATPSAVIPRTAPVNQVKDLQVRLKLVGQFAYGITGVYWSAVDRGVLAFQVAQNLPQSGVVDQRTWDRLKAATASPVAIGRTASTAQLKEVQLRLRALGQWGYGVTGVYWSALDRAVLAFQQRRDLPQSGVIDQRTWARLVALTYTPGTFDQHRYNAGMRPVMPKIGALDSRCRTGRVMCVDKATRTLTWVVDGKPLMVMWARFGRPGLETREGTFRVSRMYEYVISNLYFTPMPYSMFFSGGQAVHYSSNFARLGYASASHGCVNIGDHALVKSLFFKVRVGDKVVVHH